MNHRKCKKCGSRNTIKRGIFRWNKQIILCKECNKKSYYLLKSETDNESIEEVPTHHLLKKCKSCLGKLELSRWRECFICVPTLGDDQVSSGAFFRELIEFKISELSLLAGEGPQKKRA